MLMFVQENKREERKRMADDDAMRKIKQLEEQAYALQKQVAAHKQVDGSWTSSHSNSHYTRKVVSYIKTNKNQQHCLLQFIFVILCTVYCLHTFLLQAFLMHKTTFSIFDLNTV
jgi:hypothetical protein